MRRNSLISSRRTRTLRERPATDTRLSPSPFPTRRWKVHRPHAAYPSFGSIPRLRPLKGALTPGYRPGGRPDTLGSPEAIAPRLDSPVASFGTPPYHGDGKGYTPDPLRTVGSVWGSYPFLGSPVLPLGDPCSPGDGREFALPSLRMVERFPHTDRPQRETPSNPADMWVWRSLASRPLRLGHGPSIAYTPLPTTILTVIPDPDWESIGGGSARPEQSPRACPESLEGVSRAERGGVPPWRGTANTNQRPSHCHSDAPRGIWGGVLSSSPSIELEAEVGALAPTSASVLLSPSPSTALRERGIKGERVPPAPCEIPRKPFRRRSIKTAMSSINVQSKSHPPQLKKIHRLANLSARHTGLTLNLVGAQNHQRKPHPGARFRPRRKHTQEAQMPQIIVKPNSVAQISLKPLPFMPSIPFNITNVSNVNLRVTAQGNNIQLKEAE